MDLVAIRERLAEQVAGQTGLRVYEKPEGMVTGPAVLMGPPSATFDQDFAGGATVKWPLVVVVPRSHPDYLTTLANLLSTGGVDDQSVPDAVDFASPAPVADWWRATDFEPWTDLEIDSVSFWSAVINVEIGVG